MAHPVPYEVIKRYPVHTKEYVKYPVHVPVPYTVERKVPVHIPVEVEKPYPVKGIFLNQIINFNTISIYLFFFV